MLNTGGMVFEHQDSVNVDFQGNAGVINLNDGIKIDGIVTSTGNVNGTLNWGGAGEVTGLITNIAMLKVGAGRYLLAVIILLPKFKVTVITI
ncbi:hypothetical protein KNCP2_08140 [Candidatus Rickettsia kedanie]|uniref:Uncharacterized protein n=1 Tax=Candidatus Rickettsia kedanie TaxID=3115352 RepID=A0ABP9TTE3_9RICK